MNIFIRELKIKRKSIIIWGLSISAFLIFYMAFYPSISREAEAFKSLSEEFPIEFLEALGIKYGLSMGSLMGYFSMTFTMVQLAIAIQSANYGFSILSEEERELTAEFLLTKPVKRNKIFWSKFFAAALSLFITDLIIGIGIFIVLEFFNGGDIYDRDIAIKIILTIPLFQLIFLSIGMLISVILRRIRTVISFSMGLVIGLYTLNSLASILSSEELSYISPFYYFEPGYIVRYGNYDSKLLIIAILMVIISILISNILYIRRDIQSF